MECLVSVIVPCYNVENFIEDCVNSLNAQTYKNFEAVFVDDGSTDGTRESLVKLCAGRKNYKIIEKTNGGLSNARNTGLAAAQGEYICFLDSDDAYTPEYIEVMLKTALENKCDCVVSDYERVKENYKFTNISVRRSKKRIKIYSDSREVLCRLMTGYEITYYVWNKLYSRKLLEGMENFPNVFNENTRYAEDAEFNYICLKNVEKLAIIGEQLYKYRLRGGGFTKSAFNEDKLSFFGTIDEVAQSYKQNFPKVYEYGKAYLSVMAMEMLFRMRKSHYKNDGKIREIYDVLTQNLKFVKKCKYHPWWRRRFCSLVPVYFKLLYGRRLKAPDIIPSDSEESP